MLKTATKTVPRTKATVRTTEKKPDPHDRLKELLDIDQENWYDFAVIICEVYDGDLYTAKGHENFTDYCKKFLGISYRTGMDHVQRGKAIKKFNISKDVIRLLGGSKFKQISYIMDEDMSRSQIDDLMKKAGKMSYDELEDFVKTVRLEKEVVAKKTMMTFSLLNEQASVITTALEEAKVLFATDSNSAALEGICMEWTIHHKPELAKEIQKKIHDVPTERAPHKEHVHKGKAQKKDKTKKGKVKAEKKGKEKKAKAPEKEKIEPKKGDKSGELDL